MAPIGSLLSVVLLSATAQAQVVDYSENFNSYTTNSFSGTDGWLTGYASDAWSTASAHWVYSLSDSWGGTWGSGNAMDDFLVYTSQSWSDAIMDSVIYSNDNDAIGLIFRYTNASNYYLFLLSGSDAYPCTGTGSRCSAAPASYLYSISGGVASELARSSISYTQSQWHSIRVSYEGTTIQAWIDDDQNGLFDAGDLAFTVTDSTHTTGNVGFYSFDNGGANGTRFDDLVVSLHDDDNDGVANAVDNCPSTTNAGQEDLDTDGTGDACDSDIDGDGYEGAVDDCDDNDAQVSPVATEVCDSIDNDCDGSVDEDDASDALNWNVDADSDGYGDPASTLPGCTQPSGTVTNAEDCDDSNTSVNPAATELCDGVDNDCDGSVDEDDAADAATWYIDYDSDGYGSASYTTRACNQPSGYVSDSTDCQDADGSTWPGATEFCDSVDNDCDGTIDENDAVDVSTFYADTDGDGFGDANTTSAACVAPSGWVEDNTDCDDTESTTNPDATEYCDSIDNDCDGVTDEDDAADTSTFYVDADGDGYGNAAYATEACSAPSGWVADATDCQDGSAAAHPGGTEVCDGLDNDCDGDTDERDPTDASTWYADTDGDGFGDASTSQVSCDAPSGFIEDNTDCDDGDASVNPDGVEVYYDGVDSNCDGASDFDADQDGHDSDAHGGDDCNDADDRISPSAQESWYDGIDGDCDEASDFDADSDGFDSATYGGDDCDDANSDTWPGAPDTPHDGVINDCNLASDNDADGDGHDAIDYGGDDCDDANSSIHPGAEDAWYDGVDSNCDGMDDFDQDGDGYPLETDCDDEDPEAYPGAPGWSEDCERLEDTGSDTGTSDTHQDTSGDTSGIDTGLGGLKIRAGGGCGCSSRPIPPFEPWWFVAALGVVIRRRRNR